MDFVSQTDLFFSLHNLPSYFHHSTPPVARTLGAFFGLVVPPTKLMEPQVLMQHLCRGHFLLDFFLCYFWGAQLASSISKPNSLKDQLWTKFWNWWPPKSGVNRRFSLDKYSVALDFRNPNPVNYLEARLKTNRQNPALKVCVKTNEL